MLDRGSGCAFGGTDFRAQAELYARPEEWINAGDSVVVAPGGKIVQGPMRNEVGILYAELDPAQIISARRGLDIVGHYSRSDIFQLQVNTVPAKRIAF